RVRDEEVREPLRARPLAELAHLLVPHERLAARVGERRDPAPDRDVHDLVKLDGARVAARRARGRRELRREALAPRADRDPARPGSPVVERQPLDGLGVEARDLLVALGVEDAPLVPPDAADPELARRDRAAVRAERAARLALRRAIVVVGLAHPRSVSQIRTR